MKTKILRRRFSFFIEPGNDRKKYRDYGRFMEITHFVRQQLQVLLFFFLNRAPLTSYFKFNCMSIDAVLQYFLLYRSLFTKSL